MQVIFNLRLHSPDEKRKELINRPIVQHKLPLGYVKLDCLILQPPKEFQSKTFTISFRETFYQFFKNILALVGVS